LHMIGCGRNIMYMGSDELSILLKAENRQKVNLILLQLLRGQEVEIGGGFYKLTPVVSLGKRRTGMPGTA